MSHRRMLFLVVDVLREHLPLPTGNTKSSKSVDAIVRGFCTAAKAGIQNNRTGYKTGKWLAAHSPSASSSPASSMPNSSARMLSTTTGAKAPWLVAGRRLVRDHRPIDCGPAGLFRAGTPHRLSRGHGFESAVTACPRHQETGAPGFGVSLMHGRRIPEKGSRVQKVDCFQHGDGLKPPKIAPPLPLKWRGSRGLKPVKRWAGWSGPGRPAGVALVVGRVVAAGRTGPDRVGSRAPRVRPSAAVGHRDGAGRLGHQPAAGLLRRRRLPQDRPRRAPGERMAGRGGAHARRIRRPSARCSGRTRSRPGA